MSIDLAGQQPSAIRVCGEKKVTSWQARSFFLRRVAGDDQYGPGGPAEHALSD